MRPCALGTVSCPVDLRPLYPCGAMPRRGSGRWRRGAASPLGGAACGGGSAWRRRLSGALALLTVAGHVRHTAAWFDNGHLLTAQIAALQLRPEDASVADSVLVDWERDFPGMSDMVSSSVWADHIKCSLPSPSCLQFLPGMEAFNNWHFADMAYNPDHLHLAEEEKDWARGPSAVFALTESMITCQQSKSRFAYNMMLRFLIHIVGDLHQPMHDIQGFFKHDKRFGSLPEGDRGGNLIAIQVPGRPEITNLHAFWDAAGTLYEAEWPLSPTAWKRLAENATELTKAYPRSGFKQYVAAEVDACRGLLRGENLGKCRDVFVRWAKEAHELAIRTAYGGDIAAGQRPSANYTAEVQRVARHQLALGGYRLADLLQVIVPEMEDNLDLRPEGWKQEACHLMAGAGSVVLGFGIIVTLVGCLRKQSLRQQKRRQQLLLDYRDNSV
eukprot:TRINITY_DN72316_c0_g1_i1.p1 TRINITY_DN72316_c0_g1~~TRINITY_DN72316_c0_g1_i1.p1  ORF type:complete len:442 (-),score=88.50 TRINITY_DN72316_c0_g1_i1:49-1374(-)